MSWLGHDRAIVGRNVVRRASCPSVYYRFLCLSALASCSDRAPMSGNEEDCVNGEKLVDPRTGWSSMRDIVGKQAESHKGTQLACSGVTIPSDDPRALISPHERTDRSGNHARLISQGTLASHHRAVTLGRTRFSNVRPGCDQLEFLTHHSSQRVGRASPTAVSHCEL